MNFKSNKGYTGIDISVAMIIILIFIPTIFGIVYNMQKISAKSEREAKAINIATDVLEMAKSLDYSEVAILNEDSELKNSLNNKYTDLEISNNTANCSYSDNNVHYKIQVTVSNYYPTDLEESEKENKDFVKQITVTVTYPVGNSTKSIDISTVLKNNIYN